MAGFETKSRSHAGHLASMAWQSVLLVSVAILLAYTTRFLLSWSWLLRFLLRLLARQGSYSYCSNETPTAFSLVVAMTDVERTVAVEKQVLLCTRRRGRQTSEKLLSSSYTKTDVLLMRRCKLTVGHNNSNHLPIGRPLFMHRFCCYLHIFWVAMPSTIQFVP